MLLAIDVINRFERGQLVFADEAKGHTLCGKIESIAVEWGFLIEMKLSCLVFWAGTQVWISHDNYSLAIDTEFSFIEEGDGESIGIWNLYNRQSFMFTLPKTIEMDWATVKELELKAM